MIDENIPEIIKGFEDEDLFDKLNNIADVTKAVNLGAGAPGWNPPKFFLDSIEKHFSNNNANYQYVRNAGHLSLVESIARNYSKSYNRKINPLTEVLVGQGAGNLISCAFTAFINEGDEVIVFEPFFNAYYPQIKFNKGKIIGIPLIPPKNLKDKSEYNNILKNFDSDKNFKDCWSIDYDAVKNAINKRTKILMITSPGNPTGKLFTYEEFKEISKILEEYPDVIILMDEVYEIHIGNNEIYPRIASLPGLFDKTITIHSSGKIFSATGIRIGWCIAAEKYQKQMLAIYQFDCLCIAEPLQLSLAEALDKANEPFEGFESYYLWLKNFYRNQRNYLLEKFSKIKNFDVDIIFPDGGYFIIVDITKLNPKSKYVLPGDENIGPENVKYTKDIIYALNLIYDKNVVSVPCSYFYTDEHKHLGENYVRFVFCKSIETLDKACENLSNL